MMGHAAARQGSEPRRALPSRAITHSEQINNKVRVKVILGGNSRFRMWHFSLNDLAFLVKGVTTYKASFML